MYSFCTRPAPTADFCDVAQVTIDVLPDVALLAIFDFYVHEFPWEELVHVCRRWRNLVFGSPRRLHLRLHCTASTPVKETLDVWPLLPIVVWSDGHEEWGVDNIVAALEHNDRICQLGFVDILNPRFEKVLAVLERPFPELKFLSLNAKKESMLSRRCIPTSVFGGSAPQLRTVYLDRIPFPGLPNLLLSATHLVCLELHRIPNSGYFSPEAMVTALSALSCLEIFIIEFESILSHPDRKGIPFPLDLIGGRQISNQTPLTRALLPVLTELSFEGVSDYLEGLVAWIDAPLLDKLKINFIDLNTFDTPQLTKLISCTPKLSAYNNAHVLISDRNVWVRLPQTSGSGFAVELQIRCNELDSQLSTLAKVCRSSFLQHFVPAVERLYIIDNWISRYKIVEPSYWLGLLHPFTAVKNLYISWGFTTCIAPALQELVGERVAEVLPVLRRLFLEDPYSDPKELEENFGLFLAARQSAGLPISIGHLRIDS
jgi:hypothetical protein